MHQKYGASFELEQKYQENVEPIYREQENQRESLNCRHVAQSPWKYTEYSTSSVTNRIYLSHLKQNHSNRVSSACHVYLGSLSNLFYRNSCDMKYKSKSKIRLQVRKKLNGNIRANSQEFSLFTQISTNNLSISYKCNLSHE